MRVMGEQGGVSRLVNALANKTDLSRQVSALATAQPETTSLAGPRSDDPHGNGSMRGVRVRVGLLSDGSYGVERWLEDGTRQVPSWADA